MKKNQKTLVNTEVINPLVFCSNLPNLKGTQKNSFIIGRLGKGTKIHFFEENNFKPELAPKEANLKRIQTNGKNIVVMSY
ncbi:TPA: hypothetical protein ACTZ1F_002762 [Bacillus cereus]|uniref:hypothetical protein n=1 Tax=Bacillus cereus group TaxID=86661 RepID=UPI00103B8B2F|nr:MULTISPECIES: hypothetical protein [Bacillus cereus group]MCC3873734.1 hypothetical protein [Bacillus thuringiensis]MCC3880198.1 hypothetical protein [Bacillus thuringiensis]MCC3886384.1 hypothetical protein [Bacillus thuringiensis]MCC3892082.1 hypothetical protein [Bacillus thuringiensis]MCC3904999.1 hypothetical protein [Bacillus thuringiensis]